MSEIEGLDVAFSPAPLGPLQLRNRLVKAATFEGMTPRGMPSRRLLDLHRGIAAGGAAMTTVAYCAANDEGRTYADQMVMDASVVDPLKDLTAAVHDAGALASAQVGHAGFFSAHKIPGRLAATGPSWAFNAHGAFHGMPLSRPMGPRDLRATVDAFARAAETAARAGFDALEVHLGHGYLLSQFLSPSINRRRDAYGGDLEGRLRFPLEVLAAVRAAAGSDLAILAKTNLDDGFRGGLRIGGAVAVARALEASGSVDGLVLSGGYVSRSALFLMRGGRPLSAMQEVEHNPGMKAALRLFGPLAVRRYPYEPLFLLDLARQVRGAVELPLMLIGGVSSATGVARAMNEGFEFVQLGRALVRDPEFPRRLESRETDRSDCIRCNACIAEMYRPEGVRCVMPPRRPRVEVAGKGPQKVHTVAITGGLGVIGSAVSADLALAGMKVRILERPTPHNREVAAGLGPNVTVAWGDIRDRALLARVIAGSDAVVHLASMLPPDTETRLSDTVDVNVTATDAIVELAPPLLIYASSYTVYGISREPVPVRRREDDPLRPTDMYTHSKVACEMLIRRSDVAHTILRLSTVPPTKRLHVDPRLVLGQFTVRPDAPIEMMHPLDCARAIAAVLETPAAWNQTLNIGGGPSCQVRQRDIMAPLAAIAGLDAPLPDSTFGDADYYSQWLDTSRSVELLGDYQRHSWVDIEAALVASAAGIAERVRPLSRITRRVLPLLVRVGRRAGILL